MQAEQIVTCNCCTNFYHGNDKNAKKWIGDKCEYCDEGILQHGILFVAGTEPQAEAINDIVMSKIRTAMNDAEHDQLVIEDGDPCPKCGKPVTVAGFDGDEDDPLEIYCDDCGWELPI